MIDNTRCRKSELMMFLIIPVGGTNIQFFYRQESGGNSDIWVILLHNYSTANRVRADSPVGCEYVDAIKCISATDTGDYKICNNFG